METPIRIADLQQLAEMHRNSLALDRDQEERAFAGLDALLDLALAAQSFRELPTASSADEIDEAIAALDFTGARR